MEQNQGISLFLNAIFELNVIPCMCKRQLCDRIPKHRSRGVVIIQWWGRGELPF